MTGPVEFWFDFSSPYAYFAAAEVDRRLAPFGREVVWRPFLIGVAFQLTGMGPVSQAPLRGAYALRDCRRIADMLKLPFNLREDFPYPSQAVARAFYWFDQEDPVIAVRFAKAAFAAYFGEGRDLRGVESVQALAMPFTDGRDGLAQWLSSQEAKVVLRERTAEALDKGVFGSPFFLVDGEPFWGWDRLPMVEAWLRQHEGPGAKLSGPEARSGLAP